jgi:HD-like signal output (HDOD) protein
MTTVTQTPAAPTTTETQLDRFVKRVHSLYSLPAVALEVVQLTRSPNVDATTLTQCLQKDPALVGRVLKAVNSSLYGLAQPVANLQQGLALLGSKPLQLLVLGFSLPPDLLNAPDAKALTRFWHMALIRAVAAKEISRRWYRLPADEPFLAGLLQDLGLLALLKELGSPYARFLESADEEELDLEEAELAALGFDHRCLSARLFSIWGLPESIVTAIGTGRQIDTIKKLGPSLAPLAEACHLADLLARLLVTRQAGVLTDLLDACKTYLNLKLSDVQALVDGLQNTVCDIAKVLSVDLPQSVSYGEIIREAHERMSRLLSGEETAPTRQGEENVLSGVSELSLAVRGSLDSPMGSTVRKAKSSPNSQSAKSDESASPLGLLPAITKAAVRCRQRRQPLSVLMIQVSRPDELLLLAGAHDAERVLPALADALKQKHGESSAQSVMQIVKSSDRGFSCVLENADRQEAVELARQTMVALEWWAEQECESLVGHLSISAGAATANQLAKNLPAQRLIDAAARCLAAAATLEVSSVKSIDVL